MNRLEFKTKRRCIVVLSMLILIPVFVVFLLNSLDVRPASAKVFPVIRTLLTDKLDRLRTPKSLLGSKLVALTRNATNGGTGTRQDSLSVNPEAVVQLDKSLLLLIEQIEAKDTSPSGEIRPESRMNYTCPPILRTVHQVQDLLCMPAPKFLTDFKNPCWRSADDRFRCLPYFQIIGMDKCGSTDLFDRVARHPDVLKNSGVLHKETMWWSWRRYGHWLKISTRIETFDRYVSYFDAAAKVIQSRPQDGLITGDGTPMDMWDNSGWVSIPQNDGLSEPRVITPHLIRHVNPGVKLIIILRDPIERLFSDYMFLRQGKMTVNGFHDEVLRSVYELHSCTRKSSLRACLYNRQLHVSLNARIHLGFYSIFLKDWFSVFPQNQFLILRTEDYAKDTEQHLKDVHKFLGLRALPQSDLKTLAGAKRKYVTKSKQGLRMLEKTRIILTRLYAKYNKELSDLLQDERFLWEQTKIDQTTK